MVKRYDEIVEYMKPKNDFVNNVTSIAVIGKRRSGKTALVYHLLRNAKKEVFVFRHPKPKLIRKLGYRQMYNFEELERIQNAIIWIDEPQLYLRGKAKKTNDGLMSLLSISAQRDNCLILSTSDTRFINRGIESYIDVWLIKDIETKLVKQGSMAQKIIKANCLIDAEGFKLKKPEYLFYSRDHPELSGVHTFKKPTFFNDNYSKPYAIKKEVKKLERQRKN